jgi:hypothetical protein
MWTAGTSIRPAAVVRQLAQMAKEVAVQLPE